MPYKRFAQTLPENFHSAKNAALIEFFFHLSPWRGATNCCWEWQKYRNAKGYGVIIFDGYKFPVHRISFEHYKGLIPSNMCVMHDCDNPRCFNPDHLFLGTHAENMADMSRKGRARGRMSAEAYRELKAALR